MVHRAPAHLKVVALVGFMLLVVATPRRAGRPPTPATSLVLRRGHRASSQVPPTYILKRMVVEVPFVVFALLMPFIADRARRSRCSASRSAESGLAAAAALLVKGTLGVLASLTLAATTEPRHLLAGLERLRVPHLLVQIMGFMIRYLDVVTDEMGRMRVARESRGFTARNVRHWPILARSSGALFIRSYERGERVHLAMLARGYTGTMPPVRTETQP